MGNKELLEFVTRSGSDSANLSMSFCVGFELVLAALEKDRNLGSRFIESSASTNTQ